MKQRIRSDGELRAISYEPIRRDLAAMIRRWRAGQGAAEGTRRLTDIERAAVRGELRWAVRWLRELDCAVKLNLPAAAAWCALAIAELNAELVDRIDTRPRYQPYADLQRERLELLARNNERLRRTLAARDARVRRKFAAILRSPEYRNGFVSLTKPRGGVYQRLADLFGISPVQIRRIVNPKKK
jgi:hypothetical protein